MWKKVLRNYPSLKKLRPLPYTKDIRKSERFRKKCRKLLDKLKKNISSSTLLSCKRFPKLSVERKTLKKLNSKI
jgi:hypothetical protein